MSYCEMNLDVVQKICQTLYNLISAGFGPNALNSMLCTETGKLIVTNQGSAVVRSVKFGNPLGKLISTASLCHEKRSGDNCKSFILYLAQVVQQFKLNPTSLNSIQFLDSLPKVKELFLLQILPVLYKDVTRTCVLKDEKTVLLTKNIIKTFFQGKLYQGVIDHMTELLISLLFGDADVSLRVLLDDLTNRFEHIVIEIPTQPVTNSALVSGLVIQRNFVHLSSVLFTKESVKFAILNTESGENVSMVVKCQETLARSLNYAVDVVKTFTTTLSTKGIHLLLCTNKASDTLVEFCRQKDISVIHYVSDENLENLSHYSGVETIYDYRDVHEESVIGIAKSCTSIVIAGRKNVLLRDIIPNCDRRSDKDFYGKASRNGSRRTQQLLVCAPSSGMCNQLSSLILACLKTLRTWLDEPIGYVKDSSTDLLCVDQSHDHGYHVIGGGAFDLALYKEINIILQSDFTIDANTRESLEIFKNVFIQIPLLLLKNSYASSSKTMNFADLQRLISKSGDEITTGVSGRSGVEMLAKYTWVIQPVASKVQLVFDVIDLLTQLFRIDKVVSVTCLPNKDTGGFDET